MGPPPFSLLSSQFSILCVMFDQRSNRVTPLLVEVETSPGPPQQDPFKRMFGSFAERLRRK